MDEHTQRKSPPRDNLVRGVLPVEFRDATEAADGGQTLFGHATVFDTPTEINSAWEGNFIERMAPGAFKKTIRENRSGIRVLLNHGQDPEIGDKPLGAITDLREDENGLYYEASLFPSVPPLVMDGLRASQYGASIRFRVMREEWDDAPGVSDANPKGIPERTIKEAQLFEFGPVTWGAYPTATAGLRSLTDELRAAQSAPPSTTTTSGATNIEVTLTGDADAIRDAISTTSTTTTTATDAAPPHSDESPADAAGVTEDEPRRDTQPATTESKEENMNGIEEMRARREEIRKEQEEISAEYIGSALPSAIQARFDALTEERVNLTRDINATEEREAYLAEQARKEGTRDENDSADPVDGGIGRPLKSSTPYRATNGREKLPENIYDVTAYHSRARDPEHMANLIQEGARRALDGFRYSREVADEARTKEHIESLIMRSDGEVAQRILTHGSPAYRSAFYKTLRKMPLNAEEQRAMQAGMALEARAMTTANTGDVTVPAQIDPTLIITNNGARNPFRAISRVITTTSYLWQGVTTTGVTAQYRAEGTHMTDGTPTLVAPTIQPERADVFVPYSWEAAQDWTTLESELAATFQDAKDILECTKFAVGAGHGSNEPQGVLVGAGTVVATSGGTAGTGFSVADVYALEAALPSRYEDNATWVSSKAVFAKIRQFDTSGGGLFWANLVPGNPETLLGYNRRTASTVGTSTIPTTAGAVWGILGDFSRYVIVDRVGFQVRPIDNLFGGTAAVHYPTGQSGLVGYWRNSAGVVDSNAFRVGTISRGFA